jgi:hypothetical protein
MKKLSVLFTCFFSLTAMYAQQSLKKVVVYDWKNAKENKIVVSYSIPDAKSNETYEIDVVFYDKLNSKIPAFSLSDKKNISGIKMQYLYWDFFKDRQDIPQISKVDVTIIKIDKLYDDNGGNQANSIYKKEPEKTEEEIFSTSVNRPIKKGNNFFSIGLQGNLGYPIVGNFPEPTFDSFDEFSKDLGFYMAYNHIGIEGTYFAHSYNSMLSDNSMLYSEIESYLGYIDIILGKKGFHKSGLALVLSAGGGQYSKRVSTGLTNWDLIQDKELGFSSKIAIITSLSKNFKLKFTYSYHTVLDPGQYVEAGLMIGL